LVRCSHCGFKNEEISICVKCGSKICRYIKALPLLEFNNIVAIKEELRSGNVVILKLFAHPENIGELKKAIIELKSYTNSIGGALARLGDERVVVAPPPFKIYPPGKPLVKSRKRR